jgi:hypothetical protein
MEIPNPNSNPHYFLIFLTLTTFSSSLLGGYNSDGDRLDLQNLTLQLFELICVGLSSGGSLAKTLLGNFIQMLIKLCPFL